MINDEMLLDAGSLTRGLSVDQQREVDYILLSHAHLDHIGGIALLADNIFAQRKAPVEVYCTEFTGNVLTSDFLNNRVWPDFTKILNPNDPDNNGTLRLNHFKTGETLRIGDYSVRPVLVDHSIECHGFLVSENGSTLAYSGDTGPTEKLWEELNALDTLKAVICEVSFPNEMESLARVSGHLTPKMLEEELTKFDPKTDVPVLLYGMKPGYHEQLKDEVADLKDRRLTMLKPMDEFEL